MKKERSEFFQIHFENFLKYYDLNAGDEWTNFVDIHALYAKHVKNKQHKTPLGKNQFMKFCKLYFISRTSKGVLQVGLNKKVNNEEKEEVK